MRASRTVTLAVLLFAQLIAAVNIIYDETGWTKQDWHKYKLEYNPSFEASPADEVIKSAELRKALSQASINSLDGPLPRSTALRPLGLWAAEDGSLVETPDEESVEAAAEAITCTVCHSVVSHVWGQVTHAVHSAEPINEDSIRDMFDEACEQAHVPLKVLNSYRIVKVEAPEAGVTMFVVRSRKGSTAQPPQQQQQQLPQGTGSSSSSSSEDGQQAAVQLPGTDAEAAATVKSCKDLVNHHQLLLLKPMWKVANDYFINHRNLARRMQSKLRLDADDVDEYEDPGEDEEDAALQRKALQHIPENKLLPYDALCLDMELLCPLWASLGECAANPKWMVGTPRKLGHCRASCGKCEPDNAWRKHPIAKKELAASASSLLNSLRQTTCTSTKACLSGGGGSTIPASKNVVVQNADVLPGAALAKMDGFVLGKPFWGIPGVEPINPAAAADAAGKAAAAAAAAADPGEALLEGDELAHKHISIPGMDGFFIYQIHYKTRVYQYHMDTSQGTARIRHPPPMLELLDYLPDTASMLQSHWPYFRQMYTGGEKCGNEGAGKPRQVELRWACSPHNSWRMLVREPQFCAYVVTVYHPGLCKVPRYAPVPVKQQAKGAAKDSAAAKDAAGKPGSKEGKDAAAAAAAGKDAAGKAARAGKQGQGEDVKGAGGKASKDAKFGDKPVAA
ncbi:hypothetical protein OEZ85_001233 [Tetradesmus obliquus]|uniref:ShKT domain-containing protein n=1 Tax=Tetradesmus obliquus TaxID=3088 RepID=A0ABY8UMS0_TETOB|nr:hypothetical protein OEZ85_001233 [Tetradesmus obliquus]